MVMETPNMEVQETDDEGDQVEETQVYKKYFYFMANDHKEPYPPPSTSCWEGTLYALW